MLADPASADEGAAQPPAGGAPTPAVGTAAASTDDSAAKEQYTKLMEHVEGNGRHCMISSALNDGALEALRSFGKDVSFVDLDPAKPIRVTLPEDYYNPRGRTIAFDGFELAINRKNPSKPYISMTRTAEGVKVEPRIALQLNGKLKCVQSLSVMIEYKSDAPAAAAEQQAPR
jgi:hypothetical protein